MPSDVAADREYPLGPYIPVSGAARCAIIATCQGKQIVNVIGAKCTPGASQSELVAIGDAIANAWFSNVMAAGNMLANEYTLQEVSVVDQTSQTGAVGISNQHSGATGHGGAAFAKAVSIAVILKGAARGRRNMGRCFIGPIGGGGVGSGPPNSQQITSGHDTLAAIRTNLQALSPASDLVIISRAPVVPGSGVRPSVGSWTSVVSIVTSPLWANQRRRGRP